MTLETEAQLFAAQVYHLLLSQPSQAMDLNLIDRTLNRPATVSLRSILRAEPRLVQLPKNRIGLKKDKGKGPKFVPPPVNEHVKPVPAEVDVDHGWDNVSTEEEISSAYQLISTNAALKAFEREIPRYPSDTIVALDVEFNASKTENPTDAQLVLIQFALSVQNGKIIVIILDVEKLSHAAIKSLLTKLISEFTIIVHDGRMESILLNHYYLVEFTRIMDTQLLYEYQYGHLSAGLSKFLEDNGEKHVLKHHIHRQMDAAHGGAFWKRPFPKNALDYAADDVRLLVRAFLTCLDKLGTDYITKNVLFLRNASLQYVSSFHRSVGFDASQDYKLRSVCLIKPEDLVPHERHVEIELESILEVMPQEYRQALRDMDLSFARDIILDVGRRPMVRTATERFFIFPDPVPEEEDDQNVPVMDKQNFPSLAAATADAMPGTFPPATEPATSTSVSSQVLSGWSFGEDAAPPPVDSTQTGWGDESQDVDQAVPPDNVIGWDSDNNPSASDENTLADYEEENKRSSVGLKRKLAIDPQTRHVIVSQEDIKHIDDHLPFGFGSDDRAILESSLHRISCMRNLSKEVYGITARIGRSIVGIASCFTDILHSEHSILILGPPGTGKSSLIRDMSRILADHWHTIIVDTSNELCGNGNRLHPSVGEARRMMVPSLDQQTKVMISCLQNHTPDIIVIDEIGRNQEVEAAATIRRRGVRLVASAHGSFQELMKNPGMKKLLGGVEQVIMSDKAMSDSKPSAQHSNSKSSAGNAAQNKLKTVRAGAPVFDTVIELVKGRIGEAIIYHDVGKVVDAMFANEHISVQRRFIKDGALLMSLEKSFL